MSHQEHSTTNAKSPIMDRVQYMEETLYQQPNAQIASARDHIAQIFAEEDEVSSIDILAYDNDFMLQEEVREALIDGDSSSDVVQNDSNTTPLSSVLEEQPLRNRRQPKWQRHVFKNTENVHDVLMKCRKGLLMINIHKENSYAALSVTRSAFDQIIQDAEVFPKIMETLLYQGSRDGEIEVMTPPPCTRILFMPHSSRAFGFEISYMLRIVEKSDRQGPNSIWSQRQFAVYNRQDHVEKTSRWCFFQASTLPQDVVNRYLESCHEDVIENPFDIHTLLIVESLATWRQYIAHLSKKLEDYGMRFVFMESGRPAPEDLTLRCLMFLIKNILHTKLSLMATRHTIGRIAELYDCLKPRSGRLAYRTQVVSISQLLCEKEHDVRLIIKQLKAMESYAESLQRSLVSLLATRAT